MSASCGFRIPPAFGLDGDVCGATATTRFTSAEETWLQQYSCDAHREPMRLRLEADHAPEHILVHRIHKENVR